MYKDFDLWRLCLKSYLVKKKETKILGISVNITHFDVMQYFSYIKQLKFQTNFSTLKRNPTNVYSSRINSNNSEFLPKIRF